MHPRTTLNHRIAGATGAKLGPVVFETYGYVNPVVAGSCRIPKARPLILVNALNPR
jgi:hypothetical protein